MACPGPRPPSLKADGSITHPATPLLMRLSPCGTGSVYLGPLLHDDFHTDTIKYNKIEQRSFFSNAEVLIS